MNNKKILICTGEISGDLLGSLLINEIKKRFPEFLIYAIGGQNIKKCNINYLFNSSSWGSIGLFESLKVVPKLFKYYYKTLHFLKTEKPDIAIFIDYPGFNFRVCKQCKKLGIKTFYFFPPFKWTNDTEKIKRASSFIDYVLAPFPHTFIKYKDAGANVHYVGHPLYNLSKIDFKSNKLVSKLNINKDDYIITLFPGSRKKEIEIHTPVLIKTANILSKKIKNVRFIIPFKSSIFDKSTKIKIKTLENKLSKFQHLKDRISIVIDNDYDSLKLSKFAIITSGTATLEAALMKVPMIIFYKVSIVNELFIRASRKIPSMIGLPNIILNDMFIPELIQQKATPDAIANKTLEIINSNEKLQEITEKYDSLIKKINIENTNERICNLIEKEVKSES